MKSIAPVDRLGLVVEQWGQTRRHRGWHDALVAWAEVQRLYWERTQDIGWWSSERASVSLLSNAIWRCEDAALQEYGDKKQTGAGELYSGRPDLYAVIQGQAYIAEAKQCYPLLVGSKNSGALIETYLDKALKAARANQSPHGESRVALAFASHCCSYGKDASGAIESIRTRGLPFVQKLVPAGFAAHLLPVGRWPNFGIKDTLWEPSRRFYPGCSLIVGFLEP
jgi:hypothetical protein